MAGGNISLLQSHIKHPQLGAAFGAPGETGNGGETQHAANLQQGCSIRDMLRGAHGASGATER